MADGVEELSSARDGEKGLVELGHVGLESCASSCVWCDAVLRSLQLLTAVPTLRSPLIRYRQRHVLRAPVAEPHGATFQRQRHRHGRRVRRAAHLRVHGERWLFISVPMHRS